MVSTNRGVDDSRGIMRSLTACKHAHKMSQPSDHHPTATQRKVPATSGADNSKEPLQIRIPTAIKRRFKAHAALRGLEPNKLFVEVWDHYEATRAATNHESPRE